MRLNDFAEPETHKGSSPTDAHMAFDHHLCEEAFDQPCIMNTWLRASSQRLAARDWGSAMVSFQEPSRLRLVGPARRGGGTVPVPRDWR